MTGLVAMISAAISSLLTFISRVMDYYTPENSSKRKLEDAIDKWDEFYEKALSHRRNS